MLPLPGQMSGNNALLIWLIQLCNVLCYGCVPHIKGVYSCSVLSTGEATHDTPYLVLVRPPTLMVDGDTEKLEGTC